MSFTSLFFFAALLPAALGFYALGPRARAPYLLALSLGFYLLSGWLYLGLLLAATAATYWAGRRMVAITDERGKNRLLYITVGGIVALLAGFKYLGAWHGVWLPLGLSYYSFKLIAYIVDVYWDDSALESDFTLFALYAAFFPQIVSGPIQRPGDFLAQIRRAVAAPANDARIEEGFRLILGGLMMKLLIGDRLGAFIAIVDKSPGDYHRSVLATAVLCYTLQLYADFSGYSNIAIGVGKIFGIDSPINFLAPFAAANIQDMWRRWHMSLTSWITDYLFTPLQMALRDWGQAGLALCIVINMVVIGLWHGLTINFLIFGLLHAVYVLATAFTRKWRDRLLGTGDKIMRDRALIGAVLTFGLMGFSQIFWRNPSFGDAWLHLRLLCGLAPAGPLDWTDIRLDVVEPVFICMGIAYYVGLGAPGMGLIRRIGDVALPNWLIYGMYLLVLSAFTIETGSKFIYGQF